MVRSMSNLTGFPKHFWNDETRPEGISAGHQDSPWGKGLHADFRVDEKAKRIFCQHCEKDVTDEAQKANILDVFGL